MGRVAWRTYWWTLAAWLAAIVVYVVLRRSFENSVFWGIVLSLPLLVAGLNLVLFSRSHEEICAIEVARHRWLRTMTMGGYSRRTFLTTGLIAVVTSVIIGVSIAGGR